MRIDIKPSPRRERRVRFEGNYLDDSLDDPMASLLAQMVNILSAMQETWTRILGWEDPL